MSPDLQGGVLASSSSTEFNASSDLIADSVTGAAFLERIQGRINDSTQQTQVLYEQARWSIDALLQKPEQFFTHHDLNIIDLLRAMLECSQQIGDSSTRYTASAILACNGSSDDSEADRGSKQLVELGVAWLSHILYPMKANASDPSEEPATSRDATPIRDHMDGNTRRDTNFSGQLMQRDGFKCVLTGFWDHSVVPEGGVYRHLKCTRILKHAVPRFQNMSQSVVEGATDCDAVSMWDMLRNYGALEEEDIANLSEAIDSPANGFMLDPGVHASWDAFEWSLRPVKGQDSTYEVEVFSQGDPFGYGFPLRRVTFHDHSGTGLPLPSARFIALHRALCGILYTSGAGAFLDRHLQMYREATGVIFSDSKLLTARDYSAQTFVLYQLAVH